MLTVLLLPVYVVAKEQAQGVQSEELTFNTAVSPEFPLGLHRKYIEFIAQGLNLKPHIELLPFARRVADLRSGELDLLVGLQGGRENGGEIVYVCPSYEDLSHTLFIRKDNLPFWERQNSLSGNIIAITINGRYFDGLFANPAPSLVQVSTLKQKIQLLLRGRVDGFIHFEASTKPMLKRLGLEDVVILSPFQPAKPVRFYVAISRASKLMERKAQIDDFVKKSVARGDFFKIRQLHYKQQRSITNNAYHL